AQVPSVPEYMMSLGMLGVDFFFVLSGFIILHVHMDDQRSAVGAYVSKRLTRIYVPYLPISLALVGAYLLFPAIIRANLDWGWVTTLSLLPSSKVPALLVAWTLVHELMFYTVFLLFFVNKRLFAGAAAAWGGLLLKEAVAPDGFSLPVLSVLMHPINLEFI